MILALLYACFLGDVQVPGETITGTYRMLGTDIPAVFVRESHPKPNTWVADGIRYEFNDTGDIIDAYEGNGLSDEVISRYERAKSKWTAQTPRWTVRVIVKTRGDILNEVSGTLHQRRSALSDTDVVRILSSVARFCAMAEAYSDGAVRVVPTIELDQNIDYVTVTGPDTLPNFWSAYVFARSNGVSFDSDDEEAGKSYSSVFVVDGSLGTFAGTVPLRDRFAHIFPYFSAYEPARPAAFDSRLLDAWIRDVLHISGTQTNLAPGYRRGLELPVAEAATAATKHLEQDVLLSPVPKPTRVQLGGKAARFVDGTLYVDARFSAAFEAVLNGKIQRVPGVASDTVEYAVTNGVTLPADASDADMLGIAVGKQLRTTRPTCTGSLTCSPMDSTDADAHRIGYSGPVVNGTVALFEPQGPADTFECQVRLRKDGPLQVFWTDRGGEHRVYLSKPELRPSELLSETPRSLGLKANGEWQRVVIVAPGLKRAGLAASSWSPAWSSALPQDQIVETRGWKALSSTETPTTITTPTEEPVRPVSLADLSSNDELRRLNATAFFARVAESRANKQLNKLLGDSNTRIGEFAAIALAAHGTDADKRELRRLVTAGSSDRIRSIAAQELSRSRDPSLMGALSTMITCKYREGRGQGARLLVEYGSREASLILLAFLQETDPQLRLSLIQSIPMKDELISRRLEWHSVNDPSEEVRAAACLKLISGDTPEIKAEGMTALNDESGWVRIRFLQSAPADSIPAEQIIKQLSHAWPTVRAAALDRLAQGQSPVDLEVITKLLSDSDYRVTRGLLRLSKIKKLNLPQEALIRFAASADPETSRLAKDLSGA